MLTTIESSGVTYGAAAVFEAASADALLTFPARPEPLALLGRGAPAGADAFFNDLLPAQFGVSGRVYTSDAATEIRTALERHLPDEVRATPFYYAWTADMAEACHVFADMLGTNAVGFSLSTHRGCERFHQDRVPMRLLVTYAGTGTEWAPDHAVDKTAYENGGDNSQILLDPSALQWIKTWDIAVFKGSPDGLLHRTPDTARPGQSILMRLDAPEFWDHDLAG